MTQFEIDNLAKLDTIISEMNNHMIAQQSQLDELVQINHYLTVVILVLMMIYGYGLFKKTEWLK